MSGGSTTYSTTPNDDSLGGIIVPPLDNNTAIAYSESESATSWSVIFLFLFWALWVLILIATIALSASLRGNRPKEFTANVQSAESNKDTRMDGVELEENSHQYQQSDHTSQHKNNCRGVDTGKHKMLSLALPTLAMLIGFGFSITNHCSCHFLSLVDDTVTIHWTDSENGKAMITEILDIGLWSANVFVRGQGADHCSSTFNSEWFPVSPELVMSRVFACLAISLGSLSLVAHLGVMDTLCCWETCVMPIGARRKVCCVLLLLAFCFEVAANVAIRYGFPCQGEGSSSCESDFVAFSSLTGASYWMLALIGVVFLPLDM